MWIFAISICTVIELTLRELIISDGPFTLFAPTNEAFQKLDDRELNNLLDPSNQDELIRTLQRHVIAEEPTLFKTCVN